MIRHRHQTAEQRIYRPFLPFSDGNRTRRGGRGRGFVHRNIPHDIEIIRGPGGRDCPGKSDRQHKGGEKARKDWFWLCIRHCKPLEKKYVGPIIVINSGAA